MDLEQREISAETISPYFEQYFGHKPTVVAASPGRVNLIGEHTDYNNGFVLPMALNNINVIAVAPSPTGKHRWIGALGEDMIEIDPADASKPGDPFWSNYVRGVICMLGRRVIEVPAVDMLIDSNVPRGGGLSSSAAFEVSACTALAALCGVDLHLEKGDFVTVLGSNGAGKSTLFGAIAGTFTPDTGSVILDGKDITSLPDYKRSKYIGRMFQDPLKGTAPSMTIEENLALAYMRASSHTSPFSVISKADRADFRERLSMLGLGLEDRMNHPVGLLSGGQRQALTLLMATLVTPKLLLLDEHTAALDPATAEKVLELTKNIVAENDITCLMITHNIPSALSLGNRTIMMNNGKIVLELSGELRRHITTEQLLKAFHEQGMVSDRVLFSTDL